MPKPLLGLRILVVEDEVLLSMTFEDVLAELGCESVTVASTTDTAVALVEGHVFDAAVLDMNLNGLSSRPVADALAARGVPFVIATGNRGDVSADLGARAVLRKPFKYSELANSLIDLKPQ
jgi:CheY-like chemotaxis protein